MIWLAASYYVLGVAFWVVAVRPMATRGELPHGAAALGLPLCVLLWPLLLGLLVVPPPGGGESNDQ